MSNHPPNAKGDDRINMMKLYVCLCACMCASVFVGGWGVLVAELSGTHCTEKKKKG